MKLIKLSGVTFEGRQRNIARLSVGDKLQVKAIKNNPFDSHCVEIFKSNLSIGFIPKGDNVSIFNDIVSRGIKYYATVYSITGGSSGYSYGVTINLQK